MPLRSARAPGGLTVSEDRATVLADRLHSAAIHLLRRLRQADAGHGLSGPRLSALSVVVFGGPVTLGELAAAEQVKPPTMTRLVRALEARRLVVRQSDDHDRRIVRLRATAKGRALMAEGRARRVRLLAAGLKALEPAKLASLDGAVQTLEQVLATLTSRDRAD